MCDPFVSNPVSGRLQHVPRSRRRDVSHVHVLFPAPDVCSAANAKQLFSFCMKSDGCRNVLISALCHRPFGTPFLRFSPLNTKKEKQVISGGVSIPTLVRVHHVSPHRHITSWIPFTFFVTGFSARIPRMFSPHFTGQVDPFHTHLLQLKRLFKQTSWEFPHQHLILRQQKTKSGATASTSAACLKWWDNNLRLSSSVSDHRTTSSDSTVIGV